MTDTMQTAAEAHRLVDLIHDRLGHQVADLGIEIDQFGVHIAGRACCYHAKQLAQNVVSCHCPLPIAGNRIIVERN